MNMLWETMYPAEQALHPCTIDCVPVSFIAYEQPHAHARQLLGILAEHFIRNDEDGIYSRTAGDKVRHDACGLLLDRSQTAPQHKAMQAY